MQIIGITGTLGAGKGTVVEYLVRNKNFKHYSVRNFLTDEINKLKLPVNRDSMVKVANELRQNFGSSYIAEKLYQLAKKSNQNCIIESLRTVGEIEALKSKGDFILLAVDANINTRYKRIASRSSETDKISFEEFKENETREMKSDDSNKQNLSKCIAMNDYLINNDGNLKDLYDQIEKIIG